MGNQASSQPVFKDATNDVNCTSSVSTIGSDDEYYNNGEEEVATCFSPKNGPFGSKRRHPPLLIPCSPSKLFFNAENLPSSSASSSTASLSSFSIESSSVSSQVRYSKAELEMKNGDFPTYASNLRPSYERVRNFCVVTTAALPWMTGTAVNPLLRAAYLSQLNRPFATGTVTLVIPFLESASDRVALYGPEWETCTRLDQELYIRKWLANELPLESQIETGGIKIVWYAAKYHGRYGSIFAIEDICSLFGSKQSDVCFLEEPEHLNVYRAPGKRLWTDIFEHVVGVGHTNYVAYVQKESLVGSVFAHGLASWMVKAYCHKLIKLSPVLQNYDHEKEIVCNIHGIQRKFLESSAPPSGGIYFLGKLVWAKGFHDLSQLNNFYKKRGGQYFSMDVIGSGTNEEEIQAMFETKKQPIAFLGRKEHYEVASEKYKILLNPSVSEVLCTVTAEALAMGKFCIIPVHPSNSFFEQFPNCLMYRNAKEFCHLLNYAQTHSPEPLTEEFKELFTWKAATERCLDAAAITQRDAARLERIGRSKSQQNLANLHNSLNEGGKGRVFRSILGAGPIADQVQ